TGERDIPVGQRQLRRQIDPTLRVPFALVVIEPVGRAARHTRPNPVGIRPSEALRFITYHARPNRPRLAHGRLSLGVDTFDRLTERVAALVGRELAPAVGAVHRPRNNPLRAHSRSWWHFRSGMPRA